jgi:hypothetical protein
MDSKKGKKQTTINQNKFVMHLKLYIMYKVSFIMHKVLCMYTHIYTHTCIENLKSLRILWEYFISDHN